MGNFQMEFTQFLGVCRLDKISTRVVLIDLVRSIRLGRRAIPRAMNRKMLWDMR